MSAGSLDHHFFIDLDAPETVNGSGQLVLDWTTATIVRRWGRFVPKSDAQFVEAQQQYTNISWLIEIRGRLSITTRSRIRSNETPSRTFEVLGTWGADGKSPATSHHVIVAVRESPTAVANPT